MHLILEKIQSIIVFTLPLKLRIVKASFEQRLTSALMGSAELKVDNRIQVY